MAEAERSPATMPGQQSFAERKAQELAAERTVSERELSTRELDPEERTPNRRRDENRTPDPDGSVEDVEQDSQGLYADDDDSDDDIGDEDLEEETPSDDQDADSDDVEVDWEKRYKDLQAEFSRATQDRSELERETADLQARTLKLNFELDDTLSEVQTRAEIWRNAMAGNAQQYQNIDWSRVPPERVQEVQAQQQQAFALAQQAEQAFSHTMQQVDEERRKVKQRQAEIAKVRLRRTIPNWGNETYGAIRQFAAETGMDVEAFNEITDPQIIEWAYTAMQTRKAANKGVQNVIKTRKAQPPRGKGARRLPRDERGKFATKTIEPNVRGSFADKHRHRLAMERDGR